MTSPETLIIPCPTGYVFQILIPIFNYPDVRSTTLSVNLNLKMFLIPSFVGCCFHLLFFEMFYQDFNCFLLSVGVSWDFSPINCFFLLKNLFLPWFCDLTWNYQGFWSFLSMGYKNEWICLQTTIVTLYSEENNGNPIL